MNQMRLYVNGREAIWSKPLEEAVFSNVCDGQEPQRFPMRELAWSDLDAILADYESGALGQCYAKMEARALWRLHYW